MTATPRHEKTRLAAAVFAMATLAGATLAMADLKTAAPKNVDLTALWKINAELSDDPQKVVANKREEASGGGSSSSVPSSRPGGRRGGGMGGGNTGIDVGDIFGGGTVINGTIGGGRGGGSTGTGSGDRPAEDPTPNGSMRVPLDSFLATREQFEIEQRSDALTVRTEDGTSTCKPGETAQVRMPNGDMVEQRCGWQGGAFVTELKAPDGMTRINRYQLRSGNKQLVVVSEIKGGRGQMRGLQIKRVYERLVAF
jgi:hypothetical protein